MFFEAKQTQKTSLMYVYHYWGFPCGTVVKNVPGSAGDWSSNLGREDPPEKEMKPTPGFSPGKSHEHKSLVDYSPRGCKRVGQDLVTKQ